MFLGSSIKRERGEIIGKSNYQYLWVDENISLKSIMTYFDHKLTALSTANILIGISVKKMGKN